MSRSRTSLVFLLLVAPPLALAGVVACDTDNGDTTHGPDIGNLPIVDGGRRRLPDGAIVEADGAPVEGDDDDDDDDDAGPTPTCAGGGTAAVLAGNDTALSGAVLAGGGSWKGGAIATGAAKSKPAVVAFGGGFLGVTRGPNDKIQSVTATGSTFSAPAEIGLAGVKGPPTLTVVGTKAHLVYSADTLFKHGIYEGTSWNGADAVVGSPGPGLFSFGTNSAGLAGVGNEAVFAENGGDNGLYARTFGTAWSAAVPVKGAGTIGATTQATPEIAPISAGKSDLVIVYAYKKNQPTDPNAIAFATRQPAETTDDKKWGNADTQYISGVLTAEKFFLTAISPTAVILTFRGDDGNAYYTQGTAVTDAVTWSAPLPIGGVATAVDTAPAVAKGICGDDAIFAYAAGGAVSTVSLKGTTWSTPAAVTGASGANVAIATK